VAKEAKMMTKLWTIRLVISAVVLLVWISALWSCSGDSGQSTPVKDAMADTAWPVLGHDRRHSCQSPYVGPRAPGIKWTYTLESPRDFRGAASIDTGGNILVGSSDGLFCFRPDGTVKWYYGDAGWVYSAPVIGIDGAIYAGVGHWDSLIALTPDGEKIWNIPFDIIVTQTSPAMTMDGSLLIGPGAMWAFNREDGSLKWSYNHESYVYSTPSFDSQGNIYFCACDKSLYSLAPNGTFRWKYTNHDGYAIRSSAAVGADDTIYFNDQLSLTAVSSSGRFKWRTTLGGDTNPWEASPAIAADGTIYIGGASFFYALSPDGSIKWKVLVCGSHDSVVIDARGTIYILGIAVDTNNNVYDVIALNPDGSLLWKYAIGDDNTLNYRSPALGADGTLYFAHNRTFYALQDAPP